MTIAGLYAILSSRHIASTVMLPRLALKELSQEEASVAPSMQYPWACGRAVMNDKRDFTSLSPGSVKP